MSHVHWSLATIYPIERQEIYGGYFLDRQVNYRIRSTDFSLFIPPLADLGDDRIRFPLRREVWEAAFESPGTVMVGTCHGVEMMETFKRERSLMAAFCQSRVSVGVIVHREADLEGFFALSQSILAPHISLLLTRPFAGVSLNLVNSNSLIYIQTDIAPASQEAIQELEATARGAGVKFLIGKGTQPGGPETLVLEGTFGQYVPAVACPNIKTVKGPYHG